MATATNTAPGSPTWRANNVNRPAGAGRKWDEEMRQRIVSEVQKADAAGLPRARVFSNLAQEWSSSRTGICRGEHYTEHQVASQFHLSKERLGYEVPAQIQRMPHTAPRKLGQLEKRKLLAPPTKSATKTLTQANRTIDELRLKLAQKDARIKVLRAQRNDAQAENKELRRELAS